MLIFVVLKIHVRRYISNESESCLKLAFYVLQNVVLVLKCPYQEDKGKLCPLLHFVIR